MISLSMGSTNDLFVELNTSEVINIPVNETQNNRIIQAVLIGVVALLALAGLVVFSVMTFGILPAVFGLSVIVLGSLGGVCGVTALVSSLVLSTFIKSIIDISQKPLIAQSFEYTDVDS